MLFYRAALPLSSKTLTFTSGIIRRHRAAIGSSWRKLNSAQQALLVLAYLRKGETFAHLAAGVNRCLALSFDRPLGGLGGGLELPQRKRRRRMRRNRRVTPTRSSCATPPTAPALSCGSDPPRGAGSPTR